MYTETQLANVTTDGLAMLLLMHDNIATLASELDSDMDNHCSADIDELKWAIANAQGCEKALFDR